jgi:hypothetical protein
MSTTRPYAERRTPVRPTCTSRRPTAPWCGAVRAWARRVSNLRPLACEALQAGRETPAASSDSGLIAGGFAVPVSRSLRIDRGSFGQRDGHWPKPDLGGACVERTGERRLAARQGLQRAVSASRPDPFESFEKLPVRESLAAGSDRVALRVRPVPGDPVVGADGCAVERTRQARRGERRVAPRQEVQRALSAPGPNQSRSIEDLLMRAALDEQGLERALTVADVADVIGVNASWVYARADELGGTRLGIGQKAPIRFVARTVAERLRLLGEESPRRGRRPHASQRARRAGAGKSAGAEVLPINPRTPAASRRAA